MPSYALIPTANATGDFSNGLEITVTEAASATVADGTYDIYELVQSSLTVEDEITEPMTGLGE